MNITIEYRDGLYYWMLKDDHGITNNWATSLGNTFEQIIEDRTKFAIREYYDGIKHSDPVEFFAD